jgi:hypothetical protein
VSSFTVIPNGASLCVKLPTISVTRAFIGAMYTTLKFLMSNFPFDFLLSESTLRMASRAMKVLPAPVGAQTRRFSDLVKAALKSLL